MSHGYQYCCFFLIFPKVRVSRIFDSKKEKKKDFQMVDKKGGFLCLILFGQRGLYLVDQLLQSAVFVHDGDNVGENGMASQITEKRAICGAEQVQAEFC